MYKGALAGSPQHQQFAVKVVSVENLKRWGDKGKRNLENEVSILSKIKHRNIVRLDDFI